MRIELAAEKPTSNEDDSVIKLLKQNELKAMVLS